MERRAPLLIAVLCVVLGIGVWIYRAQRTEANAPPPGLTLVRSAWTEGRKVALRGRQQIRMQNPKNARTINVAAEVLQSGDGKVRIEYLSDPLEGMKVWEDGESTFRWNPKSKRLTIAAKTGTPDEEAAKELSLLEKNYDAIGSGGETIANRSAWIVELRPKDDTGRWKRLWIDQTRFVVLQSEDIEGEKGLVRRTTFTEVEYLDPKVVLSESEFEPPAALLQQYGQPAQLNTRPFEDMKELSAAVGFEVSTPDHLPRGYEFEAGYQTPCICGKTHRAARLVYSDGLNRLSIFQAGHPECTAPEKKMKPGGPMAEQYLDEKDRVFFWAIGNLPSAELQRILKSAAGD